MPPSPAGAKYIILNTGAKIEILQCARRSTRCILKNYGIKTGEFPVQMLIVETQTYNHHFFQTRQQPVYKCRVFFLLLDFTEKNYKVVVISSSRFCNKLNTGQCHCNCINSQIAAGGLRVIKLANTNPAEHRRFICARLWTCVWLIHFQASRVNPDQSRD